MRTAQALVANNPGMIHTLSSSGAGSKTPSNKRHKRMQLLNNNHISPIPDREEKMDCYTALQSMDATMGALDSICSCLDGFSDIDILSSRYVCTVVIQ